MPSRGGGLLSVVLMFRGRFNVEEKILQDPQMRRQRERATLFTKRVNALV